MDTKVETFMTPYDKLICADLGTSLKECNDMIWDNKLNALPVVDAEQRLHYFVFRKDYENRKNNPNELLDEINVTLLVLESTHVTMLHVFLH